MGLVLIAPLLLGGATETLALVICSAGALTALWIAWELRRARDTKLPLAFAGGCVAALWTTLQALPLPCAWVDAQQPERADVVLRLMSLHAIARETRCSLSHSPVATQNLVPIAWLLVAVLAATVVLARHGRGQGRRLLRAIAASCVLSALASLARQAFELPTPFAPFGSASLGFGPPINPNTIAGLCVLGFPLCLGLGLEARSLLPRVTWVGGALLLMTVCAGSGSRGGAAALVLAGCGLTALRALQPRTARWQWRHALWVVAVAAAVLLAAQWVAERVERQFEGPLDLSKLALLQHIATALARHPWLGVGRGALADLSTRWIPANGRAYFAENLPLQWAVEWGLPCTVIVAGLLLASLIEVRPRRTSSQGALCGLLGLLAQNMVDFSLELVGIALLAACVLGVVLKRPRTSRLDRVATPARWALPLAALGSALSAALVSGAMIRSDRGRLAERLERTPLPSTARHQVLAEALAAYPLDAGFLLGAATQAVHGRQANAAAFVNLAMDAAPFWIAPHQLAAHLLERLGALEQAAFELSLALSSDFARARETACDFIARHPRAKLIRAAAEPAPERFAASVGDLVLCAGPSLTSAEATILIDLVTEEQPQVLAVYDLTIALALRFDLRELALQQAQRMGEALGDRPEVRERKGALLLRLAQPQAALAALHPRNGPAAEGLAAEALALKALAQSGDRAGAQAAEERLERHCMEGAQACLEVHRASREAAEILGLESRALFHAERAYAQSGEAADLEVLHQTALRAGNIGRALRTAAELCQVRHRGETYCKKPASPAPPLNSAPPSSHQEIGTQQ